MHLVPRYMLPYLLDGWTTCDCTSFLTVFQSYQDDVRMIMKGCVQWNSVYSCDDFTSSEDRTGSASWLVGCFGFNGPLRQYFSLYRAVSQREGERKEKR